MPDFGSTARFGAANTFLADKATQALTAADPTSDAVLRLKMGDRLDVLNRTDLGFGRTLGVSGGSQVKDQTLPIRALTKQQLRSLMATAPTAVKADAAFLKTLKELGQYNPNNVLDSYSMNPAVRATMRAINDDYRGIFIRPTGTSGLPGSRGSGKWGLQLGFAQRLINLIAAARAAGHHISVGGGWRSYAAQVQAKRDKGNLAATPGRSQHGWGLAADLEYGSRAARRWAHAHAREFGMEFPMSWENWHIQPLNIKQVSSAGTVRYKPRPKPKTTVGKQPLR